MPGTTVLSTCFSQEERFSEAYYHLLLDIHHLRRGITSVELAVIYLQNGLTNKINK